MNNGAEQKIELIPKDAKVELVRGDWINASAYLTTNYGMYMILENAAYLFTGMERDKDGEKRLAFIPFHQIKTIIYGATLESQTEDKPVETKSPEPEENPQG